MNEMRMERWVALAAVVGVIALAGCASNSGNVAAQKCGLTIKFMDGASPTCGMVVPETERVSKSKDDGKVRWRNNTSQIQTIHFEEAEWIFTVDWPTSGNIVVTAKGETDWYKIKDDATPEIPRPYKVSPLLDGCGPQEPTITPED